MQEGGGPHQAIRLFGPIDIISVFTPSDPVGDFKIGAILSAMAGIIPYLIDRETLETTGLEGSSPDLDG
ncbi:hypothetical protein VM1G_11663 [Cytospora mali]|uniref:Uncharacterized protein n=1 Tax=Cytospora mali TaxID=578113 RepID=A0A194W145_CYTMA|nr:hypothetical protein VM1G_11663 [Valsa mali]